MPFNNKKHPWSIAIGGWGAFVAGTISFILFDYHLSLMLGLLTAAIIVTIGNAIYLLYTKRNSNKRKY